MDHTPQDLDDLETWQNVSHSRFGIKKFSAKGGLITELIKGQRKFNVSTRERHINMEQAAGEDLDPFSNGMFAPVKLVETAEDKTEIESNPQIVTEAEMTELVGGRVQTLRDRLAEINNRVPVKRMLEIAEETDARVTNVNAVKERLKELQPYEGGEEED